MKKGEKAFQTRDQLIAQDRLVGKMPTWKLVHKYGLSAQSIRTIIRKVKANSELLASYEANQGDLKIYNQIRRDEAQERLLDSLQRVSDEELKKIPVRDRVAALRDLGVDKEKEFTQARLIKGESTENIAQDIRFVMELRKKDREESKNLIGTDTVSGGEGKGTV